MNLFDATARAAGGRLRYYDDEGLLTDLITQLHDPGYTDVGLYHPTEEDQSEDFERIAAEVLPALR